VAGEQVLVIRSAETRQVVRQLKPKLTYWSGARWDPDGRSLLTEGRDANGPRVAFRIDAQTGEVSPVVASPPEEGMPGAVLSADGKSLYFRRIVSESKEWAFVQRDIASGSEKELLRRPTLGAVNLSPDGRFIATPSVDPSTNSRVALLIPVAGGEPRVVMRINTGVEPSELKNFNKGDRIQNISWAHDSLSFLIRKQVASGNQSEEIWQVPIDGKVPRKLDLTFPKNTGALTICPDGHQVAYVVTDVAQRPTWEVWVLENFLPAAAARR
jgi:dipeptidyl aminopeptidase/acylaminoacyl peptidase